MDMKKEPYLLAHSKGPGSFIFTGCIPRFFDKMLNEFEFLKNFLRFF